MWLLDTQPQNSLSSLALKRSEQGSNLTPPLLSIFSHPNPLCTIRMDFYTFLQHIYVTNQYIEEAIILVLITYRIARNSDVFCGIATFCKSFIHKFYTLTNLQKFSSAKVSAIYAILFGVYLCAFMFTQYFHTVECKFNFQFNFSILVTVEESRNGWQ